MVYLEKVYGWLFRIGLGVSLRFIYRLSQVGLGWVRLDFRVGLRLV